MALYLPEPFQSVIINTQLCFPGVIGQVEHLFYAFSLLVYVEAHFNLWVGARALFKKKKKKPHIRRSLRSEPNVSFHLISD